MRELVTLLVPPGAPAPWCGSTGTPTAIELLPEASSRTARCPRRNSHSMAIEKQSNSSSLFQVQLIFAKNNNYCDTQGKIKHNLCSIKFSIRLKLAFFKYFSLVCSLNSRKFLVLCPVTNPGCLATLESLKTWKKP